MIKRIMGYINRWRKPQGIIAYVDDTWVIANIRVYDCGITNEGKRLVIEPFTDVKTNSYITILHADDIGKMAVWDCEFKDTTLEAD